MTTYAKVLTTPHISAKPFDANEASLEDIETAEAIMPDLAYICRLMACDDTPLQMIPFLSTAARTEIQQIKVILERMDAATDTLTFSYQSAALFHYLDTHTALARENYQWCAAVLERTCITDTDYSEMRRRLEIQDYSACKLTSFKETAALEKITDYLLQLAGDTFEKYEKWLM